MLPALPAIELTRIPEACPEMSSGAPVKDKDALPPAAPGGETTGRGLGLSERDSRDIGALYGRLVAFAAFQARRWPMRGARIAVARPVIQC